MEQLNKDLYKELVAELIKDHSKKRALLFSFILSGKEPFDAFLDVCRHVVLLQITDFKFVVRIRHPEFERNISCSGNFKTDKEFLIRNLCRNTKVLSLRSMFVNEKKFGFILNFLEEIKYLEKLKINEHINALSPDIAPFMTQLLARIGPIKQISASMSEMKKVNQAVTDYKVDKLTLAMYYPSPVKQLMKLRNIHPKELDISSTADGLKAIYKHLKGGSSNSEDGESHSHQCDSVKKLTLHLYDPPNDQGKNMDSILKIAESVKNWLPQLEELVIDHGETSGHNSQKEHVTEKKGSMVAPPTSKEIATSIRCLRDMLKGYKQDLKLRIIWNMQYQQEVVDDEFDLYLKQLKKSFSKYASSRTKCDVLFKNRFCVASNASFDVKILFHKYQCLNNTEVIIN